MFVLVRSAWTFAYINWGCHYFFLDCRCEALYRFVRDVVEKKEHGKIYGVGMYEISEEVAELIKMAEKLDFRKRKVREAYLKVVSGALSPKEAVEIVQPYYMAHVL